MKRILILLLIFSLLIGSTLTVNADGDTPLFRFTCVSDMHLDDILIQGSHNNRDQFKTLLSSSYQKGYSDLFVSVGDVSSYGNTNVWDEARDSITDAGYETILWALGNHAFGTTFENTNADSDFKKFAGVDSIYYHKVIGGYHFLCMAAEKTDLLVLGGKSVYSSAQIEWLRTEIASAAADSDGKPIFVLSHYPLDSSGVEEAVTPILSRYRNVFFLWGHEHSDAWEDSSLSDYIRTDLDFITARAGCLQYGYTNQADTLLVDIYEDHVVLTYDRTDGSQLSPNSVSVPLEQETSWEVSYEKNCLTLQAAPDEDTQLLLCACDTLGRAVSRLVVEPTGNEQTLNTEASDGTTRIFYVDSRFRPVREPEDIPLCLIPS